MVLRFSSFWVNQINKRSGYQRESNRTKTTLLSQKEDEITRKKTSSVEKYQEQFSSYPSKDNAAAAVVRLIGRAESELVSIDRGWLTEQVGVSLKQDRQMILLSNDTFSGR